MIISPRWASSWATKKSMKDGEKSREFMDVDQVTAIQNRSRSGKSGPWITDWDEMAKKTVVRRHRKRLPMSTDLDEFLRQDDPLFMPPEPEAPAERDVSPANGSKRPSKLQDVVDAETVAEAQQTDERPPLPDDEYPI